jgi:hypothetical protein
MPALIGRRERGHNGICVRRGRLRTVIRMENRQQALYWNEMVDLKVACEYTRRYRERPALLKLAEADADA